MTEFRREVTFNPAWDRRSPHPSENYGIHGVDLRFVLIGPKGATHFVLFTNWHLPHVARERVAKGDPEFFQPLPADIGYHSPYPHYEGQRVSNEACEYLGGKPCYSDGSGLRAEGVYETLVREGSEGVWRELEEEYRARFEEVPHA